MSEPENTGDSGNLQAQGDSPLALYTIEELLAEVFHRPLFQGVIVRRKSDLRGTPAEGRIPHLVSRANLTRAEAVNVLRSAANGIEGDA